MERLVIPLGTTRDLARIGGWVEACCVECQLEERAAYHVQLAVDEACANVFEHGYSGQPGPIQLEATYEANELTIWIRDWGHSFDPATISLPDPAASLNERPIGGLGIYLMHRVMDEVLYQFDVGNGNRLKMVKRK